MAQSREQQILAKSTPRPWQVIGGSCSPWYINEVNGENLGIAMMDGAVEQRKVNADLIVLAVNRYEADQELIRKLTDAIGNFVCTSCDHPLRLHLDEYGCEQEGPDIEGNEGVPAHASGPCGCVGGSPAEDALIEALKAAKKG